MSDTRSNSNPTAEAVMPSAAGSAAAPVTPAPAPGAAAISYGDKREQRICANCGQPFSRNVYKSTTESRAHFMSRMGCSKSCGSVIREKRKAEARERSKQPKSPFYKGSFEL